MKSILYKKKPQGHEMTHKEHFMICGTAVKFWVKYESQYLKIKIQIFSHIE